MKLTIIGVIINSIIAFVLIFFPLSELITSGSFTFDIILLFLLIVLIFSLISLVFLAKVLIIERSNNHLAYSNTDLLDNEMAESKDKDTSGFKGEYILTPLRKGVIITSLFKVLVSLLVGGGFLFELADGETFSFSDKSFAVFILFYFASGLILISKLRSPKYKSV